MDGSNVTVAPGTLILNPLNCNDDDLDTSNCVKNGSALYFTRPEDLLDPRSVNPAFIPIIITHVITFCFGILGNVIVIFTWAGRKRLRSPTTIFLVSLAVADLLLLLIYTPLATLEYFLVTWDKDGYICFINSYIEMLCGFASVLNLLAVSIERFLVIVYPIKARRLCTLSISRKCLALVWSLAVILSVPVLFTKEIYPLTYSNNSTSLTAYYCWDSTSHLATIVAIYQLCFIFAIPALFMIICYSCVIQELWISTRTIATLTSSNDCSNLNRSSKSDYKVNWPSGKHEKTMYSKQQAQGFEIRQARKQILNTFFAMD